MSAQQPIKDGPELLQRMSRLFGLAARELEEHAERRFYVVIVPDDDAAEFLEFETEQEMFDELLPRWDAVKDAVHVFHGRKIWLQRQLGLGRGEPPVSEANTPVEPVVVQAEPEEVAKEPES